MIKNITKALALSLLFVGMVACGSDSEGPDTEGPSVVITTPNTTDTYTKGSNLPLVATFKDNRGLKDCQITIEYVGAIPGSTVLKGIGTPWAPAETGAIHKITFNEEKSKDINEPQLFDQAIEAACLSGIYKLTFVITDAAEEPNQTTETIDIKIGG